ncbi:putative cytochrome P450 6a14 isoform X4 [Arctopsyche grandis]|uniref:putative cytochrome P450 6a14 isoform X4 n=1 Tax=Arctopsyche grandis TaxID=121162 RepID=UPI00406D6B00
MRAKMTPTFTSSRMREMFDSVFRCTVEMLKYLDAGDTDQILEVKELMAKLNTDVIATCAFGIDCNTFENPDGRFRQMGKRFFNLKWWQKIMQMLVFFAPKIVWYSRISMLGKEMNDFFYGIVRDAINYRKENGVVRKDFLQILIQMMKEDEEIGKKDKSEAPPDDGTRLTMMQLAAQVFVFFIAGFETSSTTASFALYELALNPDVQKTLTDEIDDILAKHDGKITYDSLGEMTYLTKVIEETLRKYPPLPVLFRICTKDYILPDTNIKIEKDTPVMIPVYGIQRDPDIYPNPNKFDPERFTPENKAARHHFAYLPFGEGPRICIGSRFGMMQTKLGLATFLSKYEVSVCDKTLIPMEYDKRSFVLTSNGGLWLKLKRRSK